jgi:salicylate hydroxylase
VKDSSRQAANSILGLRSRTRATVIPEEVIQAKGYTNCAYRAMVPANKVRFDHATAHLMEKTIASAWIGHGKRIMAYPLKDGQGISYYLLLSYPSDQIVGRYEPGNLEEMKSEYEEFDSVVNKLLLHVDACVKWKIAELPTLRSWVSKSGKVALIGDAAHAMVPYLAQVRVPVQKLLSQTNKSRALQPVSKMEQPWLSV